MGDVGDGRRVGFEPPPRDDPETWDRMGLDPSEVDAAFSDIHRSPRVRANRREGIERGRWLVWVGASVVGAMLVMVAGWALAGFPLPFRPEADHYEFTQLSCVVTPQSVEWSGSLGLDDGVMAYTWRPSLEIQVTARDDDTTRRGSVVTENYSLPDATRPRIRPFTMSIPHDGDLTLPATCTTALFYTSDPPAE